MNPLEGYQTYILVAILIGIGILHFQFHIISNELAVLLYGILGPALAYTIRHGMKMDADKVKEEVMKLSEKIDKVNGK